MRTWAAGLPWALLPGLGVMTLLFVVPLVSLVSSSFTVFDRTSGVADNEFSLDNYARFFANETNREILIRTVRIAGLTTLLTAVIGYPVAYYIAAQRPRVQAYLILILAMPLLVLTIVRTLGWLLLLGGGGPVNGILLFLGITDRPLQLLFTEGAVLIGMVHVLLPFMVLAIFAALGGVPGDVLNAARSLGASPSKTFLRVTLPLSVPGIVAGSLLVFTLCASAFLTPAVLGGSREPMLSFLIYREVYSLSNWPMASTIAVILLVLVATVVFVYLRLVENRRYRIIFG